jgi:hypothetical protein
MSTVDLTALAELLAAVESGDASSPDALWLAGGDGSIDDLELSAALVVIEASKRMGKVDRLQVAKKAADKRVKKAAAKAIHSLRSSGHEVVEETSSRTGWSMSAETIDIPSPVGLIGLPQGDGYFPFILVAHNRDGACVCAGVAGSGQGFQDSDHAHVGRSKARDIVENARGDHNLVEVPFHVALHFAERAFAEGGGREPHGWSHMLSSVPEGTRTAAQMLDPLQKQEAELDTGALHELDALCDGQHRVVFNLEERISGPRVEAVLSALTSMVEVDEASRRQRISDEVVSAANEALDGHARQTWTLAMDVIASISEIAGWEAERKVARHTALALKAGRPGADIPFFRMWVERQLAAVSEMIMSVRSGQETPLQ